MIKWLILLFFLFTTFLFFLGLLHLLLFSNRQLEKRIKYYLISHDKKPLDRKKFNLLVQMQLFNQKIRKTVPTRKSNEKLEQFLSRAGVPLKPEEYVMFRWMSTLFFGGILYLLSGKYLFFAMGMMIGCFLPQFVVRNKYQKRIQRFNDGLPDMITVIVGSLRAGFSFPQSLKSVVEEADSPIKEEIHLVLKEMQYGGTIEEALHNLHERMPSGDLELMIQSILVQRQVGGNLATVLDTIVQTIRDRNTIQRQVQTLTAQGRMSGTVIGLLPIVLAFLIYLINPSYIGVLFTHPIGISLVGGSIVSGSLGFFFIRKLTRIEV
ncbi:MAG: type II secretion system F family protein [Bacillota bacterium]